MLCNFDFVKSVMLLLMGGCYVYLGRVILVLEDFILVMNEICWEFCLEYRFNKEIDEGCYVGVFMLDLCFFLFFLNVFLMEENYIYVMKMMNLIFFVEIKLKCGFFFILFFIDLIRLIKYLVCFYCMF